MVAVPVWSFHWMSTWSVPCPLMTLPAVLGLMVQVNVYSATPCLQEIGGNLVGAGTVLVEGGGKHQVEHVEEVRRQWLHRAGPWRGKALRYSWWAGAALTPVDAGAGSEGGDGVPAMDETPQE